MPVIERFVLVLLKNIIYYHKVNQAKLNPMALVREMAPAKVTVVLAREQVQEMAPAKAVVIITVVADKADGVMALAMAVETVDRVAKVVRIRDKELSPVLVLAAAVVKAV